MTDTDRERVAEIEGRANAATGGPWHALSSGPANGDHWYVCDDGESIALIHASDGEDEDTRQPDAEFIAAARLDIPYLLERLRRAEAERDAALAEIPEPEVEHVDCREELWSWDYFRHGQVDPYWMRCHLSIPHTEHENSETGATWTTPRAVPVGEAVTDA